MSAVHEYSVLFSAVHGREGTVQCCTHALCAYTVLTHCAQTLRSHLQGYKALLKKRKELMPTFVQKMNDLAEKHGER
jgi:hypothetical protein